MGSGYNGIFFTADPNDICWTGFPPGKRLKSSLGKGWQAGLNFGIRLNRYIAVEIGLGYSKGDIQTYRDFFCDTAGNISWLPIPIEEQHPVYPENFPDVKLKSLWTTLTFGDSFNSHNGHLNVSIRLSPGFRKWDPYVKMGINVMISHISHYTSANLGFFQVTMPNDTSYLYHSGRAGYERMITTSFGFTAAFGVTCRFTPTVSMFAEWQFTLMSSVAKRNHMVNLTQIDGTEETLPILDKVILNNRLRSDFVLPFSNTGINIGFKFAF